MVRTRERKRLSVAFRSIPLIPITFILLIISLNSVYSQEDPLGGKNSEIISTKIKLNPYSDLKFFLGSPVYDYNKSTLVLKPDYLFREQNDSSGVPGKEDLDLALLRENLNKSFIIMREGQRKYDLGIFGKILGYTNAAAAVGLAIYHISKYGIK